MGLIPKHGQKPWKGLKEEGNMVCIAALHLFPWVADGEWWVGSTEASKEVVPGVGKG